VTSDSATWTNTFWNALSVCTWSLHRGDDEAELYGFRLRVVWAPDATQGEIVIERLALGGLVRETVDAIRIYRNFDPVREAAEIARHVYWLQADRSA
jgi:hypothetical protein